MSRQSESRAATARPRKWRRPNKLEAPTPPEGMHYRWIRAQTYGQDDLGNMSSRLREGYEPVRADEHPCFNAPTINDGQFKGVIGVGGLILAKIPKEIADDRQAQMHETAAEQMATVDNDLMKVESSSMPVFADRKTTVRRGTRARFANEQ